MTAFTIAFASLALLLGIYAFVGLPFGSRWRRVAVSSFFALLLAGLFFGYSDMLGRPKSARIEVLRPSESEAKVLGSYVVEGAGIYLWLQLKDVKEPRYYVLPWQENTARDLQRAIERTRRAMAAASPCGSPSSARGTSATRCSIPSRSRCCPRSMVRRRR